MVSEYSPFPQLKEADRCEIAFAPLSALTAAHGDGSTFQALLLTGHIPHVHLGLHPAPAHPPGFYPYQTAVAERDQHASPVVRMHRPTFETGMIFPQWGQTAYSTEDPNWSIGLSDIQQQTAAQWVAIPINLYQTSVTSTQVTTAAITPTIQALVEGIHAAKARYYHVFVVPLLTTGGTLTWYAQFTSRPWSRSRPGSIATGRRCSLSQWQQQRQAPINWPSAPS